MSKPPSLQDLHKQLQEFMQELKKPEFYRDEHVVLYNDLLILKNIVPNLPTSYYPQLSKELAELQTRLRKSGEKKGFFGIGKLFSGTASTTISLEIIMKLLQTVEKKNILLEDFLACSGYCQKEMTQAG